MGGSLTGEGRTGTVRPTVNSRGMEPAFTGERGGVRPVPVPVA